jgi:cytochrome c2
MSSALVKWIAAGAAAAVLLVITVAAILSAKEGARVRAQAAAMTGGDPRRGEAMFIQYGCGSCHAVRNVRTAVGNVGPPLDGVATRVIIAGRFANTPENMEHWIRQPQQISPGTAMPDLNVGERDGRDIAAFLYTRGK